MLIRILNTLRSRIWDRVLFLFSDYLNLRFNNMECARRLWSSGKLNFKGLTLKLLSFQHKSLICYSYLMENFSLVNSHSLLDNPHLPIQDLNTNFHLEPKNRKLKIWDRRKCDIGASKNAKQAFSTPRLSSHFLLSQILGFRFFSPSNKLVYNPPFSPTVDLE